VVFISADSRLHPQASKDAGNANNGASDASEQNLQNFIDNFVCQSNQKGVKYYFFEFFDEKWKDDTFGGVEGHWGLFYQKCVSRAFPQARVLIVSPQ
jgi:flavodoxin